MNLPIGRTMKAAWCANRSNPKRIIMADQVSTALFAPGNSLSAPARRLMGQLVGAAGGDAWVPGKEHIVRSVLLRGRRGRAENKNLTTAVRELAAVQFELVSVGDDGKVEKYKFGGIFNDLELVIKKPSYVRFKISSVALEIFRRSQAYAIMNHDDLWLLRSRYAITLYQIAALVSGRSRTPFWSGSVDSFRKLMGVHNAYEDWRDLELSTLVGPSRELIIVGYKLTWTTQRMGRRRKVIRVKLTFKRIPRPADLISLSHFTLPNEINDEIVF